MTFTKIIQAIFIETIGVLLLAALFFSAVENNEPIRTVDQPPHVARTSNQQESDWMEGVSQSLQRLQLALRE